jgi:hypothetical protein
VKHTNFSHFQCKDGYSTTSSPGATTTREDRSPTNHATVYGGGGGPGSRWKHVRVAWMSMRRHRWHRVSAGTMPFTDVPLSMASTDALVKLVNTHRTASCHQLPSSCTPFDRLALCHRPSLPTARPKGAALTVQYALRCTMTSRRVKDDD